METCGRFSQTCKPGDAQKMMRPMALLIKPLSRGLPESRKPLKTGAFERFSAYSHSANRNKNQSIRGLQIPQNAVFPGVIPYVSDMQIHSGIKLVSIRYWHFRCQTVYYSTLNNDTCPTHPKYVALEWFTILQANGDFRLAVSAKPVIRKLN